MSGNKLFADTNILLYFLQGNPEVIEMFINKNIFISVISELELLSFSQISKSSEETIKAFLKNCTVVELNSEIKNLTIELRRKFNLKLPDSIVAATAYYLKLPLLTADKGFSKIEGMQIIMYDVKAK